MGQKDSYESAHLWIHARWYQDEIGGCIRKRERKKSLTRGHVKDIGSAKGIQFYRGQGYEGAISGK
jgi:hypothetical protein